MAGKNKLNMQKNNQRDGGKSEDYYTMIAKKLEDFQKEEIINSIDSCSGLKEKEHYKNCLVDLASGRQNSKTALIIIPSSAQVLYNPLSLDGSRICDLRLANKIWKR